ncbi:hypothetical protein D9M68_17720 [compost metagenome]
MVDKDYEPLIPFDQDTDKILAMVDAMKAEGYRTREFTIGPVDVISSKTGDSIFEHRLIKGLAERFESVVIPLALMSDEGLGELCAKVNVLMKGKSFTLATPFQLKSADNEKHVELIRKRVRFITASLPDVKFELLYLTVNMIGDTVDTFDVALNRRLHDLDFGVRRLVEFVFPHSRKGLDNLLTRDLFIRNFSHFCEVIKQCKNTDLNRHLIKPADDSYEATYRDGKLYYTPTLIEKFPIFDPTFAIPDPWAVKDIELFKMDFYLNSLMKYSGSPICGSCCHLNKCAEGDVHVIMSHLQHYGCLVSMYNDWDAMPCKVQNH